MSLKAKTILKDKFWILEDNGKRVGTLSWDNEKYIYSNSEKTEFFNTKKDFKKKLGSEISFTIEVSEPVTDEFDVNGFPTKGMPYNSMYDVKKKLPLFTKSENSKSVYCAGYYLIKFNVNWLKSFCPKLITIERNDFIGPFKTEFEMKQELSRVNRTN